MNLFQAKPKTALARSMWPGIRPFLCALLGFVPWAGWSQPATDQLAITEAFSFASDPPPGAVVPRLKDFWELTNFGDQALNLTGYKWNDSAGVLADADPVPFVGLSIDPGESIVFVESDPLNMDQEEQFRACWAGVLREDAQVIFYDGTGNGLAGRGDGIRLWGQGAISDDDLVDSVVFGEALTGHSFISEPNTGRFGYISVDGEDGAIQSRCGDDVASPGFATNSVPMAILGQPQDLEICPGIDATFSVDAIGLPRPKYEWFHDGVALTGARGAVLVIPDAQPEDRGIYQVRLSNGSEERFSVEVTLSVMTETMAPSSLAPLPDESCLVGETARLTAYVCANPPAQYQWFEEGVAIAGGTNRTLTLPNRPLNPLGTRYCIVASNELGRLELCAMLFVDPLPELEFTEVMACSSPLCLNYGDWFELTNVGTNAVDLAGYRFASSDGRPPSLVGAWTIEGPAILGPGQSAIFVDNMTPEAFRRWWGCDALRADLLIQSYYGHGLYSEGDELYLWSKCAEAGDDYLIYAQFAGDMDFCGISQVIEDGRANSTNYSVLGEDGAFQSFECGNVGSPGFTAYTPPYVDPVSPRILESHFDSRGMVLTWSSVVGRYYRILYKESWMDFDWKRGSKLQATDRVTTVIEPITGGGRQRFFKVEVDPHDCD